MTVAELIKFLETQPQHLVVAFDLYSEHHLLETEDIRVMGACAPRPDGWVARERPDKEVQQYLMFPGN